MNDFQFLMKFSWLMKTVYHLLNTSGFHLKWNWTPFWYMKMMLLSHFRIMFMHLAQNKWIFINVCVCMHAYVKQKSPNRGWLFCNPVDYTVHGILWIRILEWVAISFSRVSSWSRDWTQVSYVSCTGRQSGGMNKKQSIKIWKIQIY